MNQNFFVGIVENRVGDPLKLGRVQCRIFGVHSESLNDIPTASLPWAVPLMPSTSASLSGIGHSVTQYLEGSSVMVFFLDGDSKQQPMIMGSFHGAPLSKTPFDNNGTHESQSSIITTNPTRTSEVKSASGDSVLDSSGTPVTTSAPNSEPATATGSSQNLKDALGKKESSNNYKAVNQLGYIGKYQMGAAMLTDLGYVKSGTKNRDLTNPENWTGKGGVKSKEDWLNNPKVQEAAMDDELSMNEKRLKKLGVVDSNTTEQEKAGYLATSHLLGTGGARDMKNGITKSDANGVTGHTYYNIGYKAVSGKEPTVSPDAATLDNPSREASIIPSVGNTVSGGTAGSPNSKSSMSGRFGFSDPNGKYPRYLNEQDTNRLSRNQNIEKTIVPIKEESEDKGVSVAGGSSWNQSPTPYNAKYPFNHVYESESGHLLEFDDTPNNERINIHHKSGTFQEVDRNGTEVRKIVGDKYEIWERNGYVHVKGTVNITVEGDANIQVGANCVLEVAGNLKTKVGGSSDWEIGGDANWSVGGDWKVKSGGNHHITAGEAFAADAISIDLNSGASTAISLPAPSKSSGTAPVFNNLSLEPRGFSELSDFEGGELSKEDADARSKKLFESGLIDIVQKPAVLNDEESIKAEENKIDDKDVSCGTFISGSININDYISTNFKLKDLTRGSPIPAMQGGFKDVELACNLKALAENVLEPIKSKYPDMIITSGLRPFSGNLKSQHPLGQAVDIQFTSKSSSDYVSIAKDLSASISFDQLILEYRTSKRMNGHPVTWLHVSYSKKGNKKQVFTMDNDLRVGNFGELKAIS